MVDFPFSFSPATTAALMIDLDAVAANYRFLSGLLRKGVTCSAIVKANAYGLGASQIARRLYKEGCRHFFVANLYEGTELYPHLPQASIYILNGLRAGEAEIYHEKNLIPVLNSLEQIDLWNQYAQQKETMLPAVIHFDTGITRTGLSSEDTEKLNLHQLSNIELRFLMSHLACASQPDHSMNPKQRELFLNLCRNFPPLPRCFANSAGIFLGQDYHLEMVRPGIALYGLGFKSNEFLKPCVQMYGQVLQVSTINAGQPVGYDSTYITPQASRIAILGVGYADGYPGSLGNKGRVYIKGYYAPIVGRISMDLMTIDISQIPEPLCNVGDWVELFGHNIPLEEVAQETETIIWELLTGVNLRVERLYLDKNRSQKKSAA